MKISLNRTVINTVDFSIADINSAEIHNKNNGEFHVNFDKIFDEQNLKTFIIKFNIKVVDAEELFSLKMSVNAYFDTDEDIDEDFKNSSFPNINAPAIAYPFLRAQVSQITLIAGINPVMLPTINFTNFLKSPKSDINNQITD